MGAWGTGVFENDTACDWSYGLEDVDDLSLVEGALDQVLSTGSDYLDSDVAVEALAACEVIARLRGRSGERNAYTKTVDAWVAAHSVEPPAALIQRALAAIDRVLAEPSELLELWSESDSHDAWRAGLTNLRERIGSP
jgi:hypothetical protein